MQLGRRDAGPIDDQPDSWPGGEIDPNKCRRGCGGQTIQRCLALWMALPTNAGYRSVGYA
jgi:hypothetical protein